MTAVLFVRLSAMGDLVHGLGAVVALHESRPDWRLTFVTQSTLAPLLRGIEGIARVVPFDRQAGIASLRCLRRDLQAESYEVALDLQGNWKSAFVAWLSGAPRRVGMSTAGRREPLSRILLTTTIERPAAAHPARAAMELVRTVAPEARFRLPRLLPTPDEVEREQEALSAIGIDWGAPFRVVVVTDPRDPRALRPAVVASETLRSPEPVVHLVGPDRENAPDESGVPTLRHGREPRRLVALGAIAARAGGVVLGPDQGATHVLAAAGARCIVLFGAQDPLLTAPPSATALVHPRPPECRPCRRRTCNHASGPVCMDFGSDQGIAVDLGFPTDCEGSG